MRRWSRGNDQYVLGDLITRQRLAGTVPNVSAFPKLIAADWRAFVVPESTVAFHAVTNKPSMLGHSKAFTLRDAFARMDPLRNSTANWCNPDFPTEVIEQNKLKDEDNFVFGTPKGPMRVQGFKDFLKRETAREAARTRGRGAGPKSAALLHLEGLLPPAAREPRRADSQTHRPQRRASRGSVVRAPLEMRDGDVVRSLERMES